MGIRVEFTHRLRQLDVEVEQLRAAVVALQRRLAEQPGTGAASARGDAEEYLRAYT